jgi:hypothetical protein
MERAAAAAGQSRLWRDPCGMKVGILTFHSSYNFGANLQTLALHEMLKRRGCRPVVIDYRDPWKMEMYRARVAPAQVEAHERFIEKYLHTSPRFSCAGEVQEYCNDELDLILVGSDQVLRLLPKWTLKRVLRQLLRREGSSAWTRVDERLPVYWLPWPKPERQRPARACISACAGATMFFCLGRSLSREARRCLSDFDFVSVRDDWTGWMVKWLSRGKVHPEFCPDPVFGLNDCFRVPPEEVSRIDVSRTILVSAALDTKWLAEFRNLAHERGFTLSNLPDPHDACAFRVSDVTIDLPLSPLMWYDLLSKAAGYIGIRYHGLVSCAANGTPALNLDVSHRPRLLKMTSRPYDLCCKAGAKARYVPLNWLAHPSPTAVLGRLMEESSQAAVDRYAGQAKARLTQVLDHILTRVAEATHVSVSRASDMALPESVRTC